MSIITSGRTDLNDFFHLSGLREYKKLSMYPLIVFVEKDQDIIVEILYRADHLMDYANETKVMAQWGGQYCSDFFQFTVGQFKDYVAQNPKKEHYII
jgi:hypothetical protein